MEYEDIRAYIFCVCEDVKLIFRNTVKDDVFSLSRKEKLRLLNLLHSILRMMSLTSDLWTSVATNGYICLTTLSLIAIGSFRKGL